MMPSSIASTSTANSMVARSNAQSCQGAAAFRRAGGFGSRCPRDSTLISIGPGIAIETDVAVMILPLPGNEPAAGAQPGYNKLKVHLLALQGLSQASASS